MKLQDFVDLVTDCSRRDFTINAMAIDMETGDLIDPHGGFKDLKARTLRHVGPAFKEDPLRVIRLARFLGRLHEDGFQVAAGTFALASDMVRAGDLNELPWERFAAEVRKVLDTCSPEGCFTFFQTLHQLGAHQHVGFFRGADLLMAAEAARAIVTVKEARAKVLAATVFTEPEVVEHIGGSVARDAAAVMARLHGQPSTPERLLEAIRLSGGWNETETFHTFIGALMVLEHLGVKGQPFTAGTIIRATAATRDTAAIGATLAAQGVKGAAIGQAIRDQRLKVLQALT